MILSEIRTGTRFLTKTDSTTFSDTDLDREANIVYNNLVLEMVQASGQLNEQGEQAYTDFKAPTGLVAGDNGYNGEYALPSDCLVLKRVEAKKTETMEPIKLYDVSENVNSEFEKEDNSLGFRLFRNSMIFSDLPETTVTNGIYLEYIKRNAVLTASDAPVFESNMHDLVQLGTAVRYFMRNPEKFNALVKNEHDEKLESFRIWYREKFPQVMKFNPIREQF
jgi:hypothetical protein